MGLASVGTEDGRRSGIRGRLATVAVVLAAVFAGPVAGVAQGIDRPADSPAMSLIPDRDAPAIDRPAIGTPGIDRPVAADTAGIDQPVETTVTAALVAETATAQPGATVTLGLHFDIPDGWHTYWRNPGDSGAATAIDWTLPPGVAAGAIQWPYPARLPVGPLVNFGYEHAVTHLIDLTVPADWPADRPMPLLARVEWLVCADICIPEEATLSLSLPVSADAMTLDPATAARFEAARARLPAAADWDAAYARHGGRLALSVDRGMAADTVHRATFFPADPGWVVAAAAQSARADGTRLVLDLAADPHPLNPVAADATLAGVLVLEEAVADGRVTRAVALAAPPGAVASPSGDARPVDTGTGAPATASGGTMLALWQVLALALAGGLVLNLMPCVFPVLSIKAMALVRHGGADAAARRRDGLAYTAGVLVSFAVVAIVLLALQAGGAALGWGFQLQSPAFVGVLALVLFAVGLSLSGVFTLGGAWAGAGQSLAGRGGLTGSFFTGVLATVVATPCTAPFMGTAVGVALAAPPAEALAILLTLGLGLALPFLVLAFVPGAGRWLPRPGAWMEWLKQALAFPMYASAAWLIWVLAQQTGPDGLALALAGLVGVALAAWLWRLAGEARAGQGRRVAGGFGLVALAASVALMVAVPPAAGERSGTVAAGANLAAPATASVAEPFSEARLAALRAADRPVFVNITAAWCITCLVNEQVALAGGAGAALLDSGAVAYLKGDWTNRDPAITAYLASFGRSGVPLYVVYPAGGGAPVVLAQVLSPAAVEDAFTAAIADGRDAPSATAAAGEPDA